jgi:hypothetical protein
MSSIARRINLTGRYDARLLDALTIIETQVRPIQPDFESICRVCPLAVVIIIVIATERPGGVERGLVVGGSIIATD